MSDGDKYQEWNKQGYVSEFLSLKCAGDVLKVVSPLGSKAQKEITESMAVVRALRDITLREPRKYGVLDLCAGNGLTGVIIVHLLPVIRVWAFDKRARIRAWNKVQRFAYIQITLESLLAHPEPVPWQPRLPMIVVSVHPCKDLAVKVVEIYHKFPNIRHLVMMPCCKGQVAGESCTRLVYEKLTRYERWCEYLAFLSHGDVYLDNKCLSPCRGVVVAHK